jgi:hypothetical protein
MSGSFFAIAGRRRTGVFVSFRYDCYCNGNGNGNGNGN